MSSRSGSQQELSFSGRAGTPLYMSPEQLEHTRCTGKVDIYALGIIFFEMNYVFKTQAEKHKVSYHFSFNSYILQFYCIGSEQYAEGRL